MDGCHEHVEPGQRQHVAEPECGETQNVVPFSNGSSMMIDEHRKTLKHLQLKAPCALFLRYGSRVSQPHLHCQGTFLMWTLK